MSEREEIDLLRQKIIEKIESDPMKAAIILTDWLKPVSDSKKKAG